MRIVKALLWALAWLAAAIVGLLVVFYLILLAVNWNDQAPSEAVLRLEASYESRPFIDDQDNAYVYLMGFSSGKTEDPREWGKRRIAWSQKLISQAPEDVGSDPLYEGYNFKSERSAAVSALSEVCKSRDRECLAALENGEDAIVEWLATEGWLLDRYMTLISHSGFLETTPLNIDLNFPAYADVFEGQKLLFIKAWEHARQGEASNVQAILNEDMRFWRQSLVASDTLISRMIAVAALKRNFELSNIVIRRLPTKRMMQALPQQWMSPFSDDELSMSRCLTGEWVFGDNVLRQVKDRGPNPLASILFLEDEQSAISRFSWLMLRPLLQPQDSSNRYAEFLLEMTETLDVSYDEFFKAIERSQIIERQIADDAMPPSRMYNIVGDIWSAMSAPEFTEYVVRVYDLEGIRQAALLSATLRSQNIAPDQVDQHLHDAQLRNPYNGEPFHWDEFDGVIVFIGLEPGERGRHSFLY